MSQKKCKTSLAYRYDCYDFSRNNVSKFINCARNGRSGTNIEIREIVTKRAEIFIRHRTQDLDISTVTLQRIRTTELHLHAYKMELFQQFLPTHDKQRREFTN